MGIPAVHGGEDVNETRDTADPDWEYRPLRLPPGITRISAATQLTIHAEFSGWELSRVLVYADGTRKVWLRRKRSTPGIPELRT